jgi:rhodanese-related sulfurtransferase
MDECPLSVSAQQLYACLGTVLAPVVIDVRRDVAFAEDSVLIVSAYHRPPDQVSQWAKDLPRSRPVVAYCVHGHEVSQRVTSALRDSGIQAAYLDGGISAWKASGLPTRRKTAGVPDHKWITRERPKIDRIACPWLVSRFINPLAEFLYVPAIEVLTVARQTDATPYDVKGVDFGHHGDRCSFDAIIQAYDVHDPALDRLAVIVRGADTSHPTLAPQCEGLLAISYGLSANFPNDHDMLGHGLVVYDALYAWCRLQAWQQA